MKVAAKLFVFILAGASGAASLMYFLLWMRRFGLAFGTTTLAIAAVTATFAAGLCLGTWIWDRFACRRTGSSLIAFGVTEIGAGLYGLASLWIFHEFEAANLAVHPSAAGHTHLFFAALQFVLSALVMVPPAIMMGGTLPLLARLVVPRNGGFATGVGAVYGATALGAAVAAVAMTYGMLPYIGLTTTLALAAAVNVLAGIAAFSAEMQSRKRANPFIAAASSMPPCLTVDSPDRVVRFVVLIGLAASGFAVATFEICWVRLIAMVMGPSIYVYSASVAVALAGMGIGSAVYSCGQRTPNSHQRWFAMLASLIAFTGALSLIFLQRIPFLSARFFPLFQLSFGRQVAANFITTTVVALLPSVFFGAMFPAAIGSLAAATVRVGSGIGAAYAMNMFGVVAGACITEFVFIPTLGVRATIDLGVLAAVAAGLPFWWRVRVPKLRRVQALAPAAAALLIVAILPRWDNEVFAARVASVAAPLRAGETRDQLLNGARLLYYHDGSSSTVSVDETGQTLLLHSNGNREASTDPVDMADQLLLGHLPMLLHRAPQDVLLLNLGTGITAAAVARYAVRQIDIVEPEPAMAHAARFFDSYTNKVLDDSRVHLIIGNGRHRLLAFPKQYDVAISSVSDLWAADAASLTTLEFYRIAGARLKPGGIFAQSIHTQGMLPDDLDLLAATFHAEFPHMEIWTSGPGNLLFLGTRDLLGWDYAWLEQHFTRTPGVEKDLDSIGIWNPFALFGAEVLGENESNAFSRDINKFNTDDRPVLEFRTARSLFVDTAPKIAKELNPFRRPDAPAIAGFDPQHDLDADGTYLLGFAYASMGQPDLGIRYMERSTDMAPNRPMFFVGLGNQYRATGRVLEARTAYERALALDLNNLEALISLGEIRLDEGQTQWTRVLTDRAMRLAPEDARVHALIDRLQEMER